MSLDAVLGAIVGAFRCLWVPLGPCWGSFGHLWGVFGPLWMLFGAFLYRWEAFGDLFGAFGNLRVPFELPLGSFGQFSVIHMFIFAVRVHFVMILYQIMYFCQFANRFLTNITLNIMICCV